MPIVTFSSPALPRDVRAYAIPGDTLSVLAVAEKNTVNILSDCRSGGCGACLVRVEYLDNPPKLGAALGEAEKTTLRSLKKLTKAELADAEQRDIPPPYRLACQFVLRDEEVVIHITGEPAGSI